MYSLSDKNAEVFSADFMSHLDNLNQIVAKTGQRMEGNLCYLHKSENYLGAPPDPSRAHRRRNYFRVMSVKSNLLEVGFNAGHSALLCLMSNPSITYFGVDIGANAYSRDAADYLRDRFGNRFEIIFGDSREVLPALATHRRLRFDAMHVDGGHGDATCRADISNCLRLASSRSHLILDDTGAKITNVYNEFVLGGYLITETLGGFWEGRENLLARALTVTDP